MPVFLAHPAGKSEALPLDPVQEEANLVPFEGNLTYGMINDEVAVVQQILIFLGYDAGVVDGCFGAATQEAVMAFQNDHGLYADGIVGAMTKAALGIY